MGLGRSGTQNIIIRHLSKPLSLSLGDANAQLGFDRDYELARSCCFLLAFNVFNTLVGLPFSVYSTFVVEQRHGFNKQTAAFYVKDQIKKFVISQVRVSFSRPQTLAPRHQPTNALF